MTTAKINASKKTKPVTAKTAKIKTSKPKVMKTNAIKPARILFVLDRSGSMQMIKTDTIGGFNSFVNEQKKLKAKTTFTLVQFDNVFDTVYKDVDIQSVVEMTDQSFQPRGGTALYDAIAKTVLENKSSDKDVLTILAVLTDGEENGSREFSNKAVNDLLKDVQENMGWEVYFIGANIDANKVGGSLGVMGSSTMTFDGNAKGIKDGYTAINMVTSAARGFLDKKYAAAYAQTGSLMSDGKLNAQTLYNSVKSGLIKEDEVSDKK